MTTHASLAGLFPTAFVRTARVIFADAVREHQDEVYGVALRILGDRDAAREAASATFLKAYRSWDRYDQARPVRHWLLASRRTRPSAWAVRVRASALGTTNVDDAFTVADPAQTPDQALVAREEREACVRRSPACPSCTAFRSCSVTSASCRSRRSRP